MKTIIFILITLVGFFFVDVAKARAEANKAKKFTYKGISIWCYEEQKEMIREALDKVVGFFQDDWGIYKNNVKSIIVNAELHSVTLVSQKAVIIIDSDISRLRSATHLAGWLVFDYEQIQTFKNLRCDKIPWHHKVFALAYENGQASRKRYLAER